MQSLAPYALGLALALAILAAGVAGLAGHARAAAENGCLHGASLELRFDAAWSRWAIDGLPMRNCDAEALQEASVLVRECPRQ